MSSSDEIITATPPPAGMARHYVVDESEIAVPLSAVDWQAVHRGEVRPPELVDLPETDRRGDDHANYDDHATANVYKDGSTDYFFGHVHYQDAAARYTINGELLWHRGQDLPAQAGPHDDAAARDGAKATVLPAKLGTEAPALDERNTGQAGAVPAATPEVLCPRCDRKRMAADLPCCFVCMSKQTNAGMEEFRQRELREFRREHHLAGLQTTRPVGSTTEHGGVLGRRWL